MEALTMPVAIITGASRGLGRALAGVLAARGWCLVLDARAAGPLRRAAEELAAPGTGAPVTALAGDVTDPAHRSELVAAAWEYGGLDLLVNNASALGAEPLVPLAELSPAGLREALEVNAVAPLALVQEALPMLRRSGGAVLNVTSDAAVEAYPTWGGYGASKAALEQWSAMLAEEEPGLRVWRVDPGDLRTALYDAAVPDDPDAANRPDPAEVAPALLSLWDRRAGSGRYTVAESAEVAR
jgi:NAD(P)-dependent dehydrogenase (short-subunit alcohol dehydrogenase family)